jgi:predicted RNA-binding protein with PUA-like domain
MNYWILKTEPETYSIDDLAKAKKATWDGIRNYAARKNLQSMRKGDICLIYHTGDQKAIVGSSVVIKTAYPETKEPEWFCVDLAFKEKWEKSVTLEQIKKEKSLAGMVLLKQGRLSVSPVTESEYKSLLKLC